MEQIGKRQEPAESGNPHSNDRANGGSAADASVIAASNGSQPLQPSPTPCAVPASDAPAALQHIGVLKGTVQQQTEMAAPVESQPSDGMQRAPSRQLAVADWLSGSASQQKSEPAAKNGTQAAPKDPTAAAGHESEQQEVSDATTVSENGRETGATPQPGGPTVTTGMSGKRSRSPAKAIASPSKARRTAKRTALQQEEDESDAIAALEQIRSGLQSGAPMIPQPSAPLTCGLEAVPGGAAFLEAASRLPPGALQVLAQLVQQRTMAQGTAPVSQRLAALAALQKGLPSDALRSCFSESSAERLLGQRHEARRLGDGDPTISVAALDLQRRPSFGQVKERASSGPLPGRPDLSAASSQGGPTPSRPTAPTPSGNGGLQLPELVSAFAEQAQQRSLARPVKHGEDKAELGSFGSIISTAMETSRRDSLYGSSSGHSQPPPPDAHHGAGSKAKPGTGAAGRGKTMRSVGSGGLGSSFVLPKEVALPPGAPKVAVPDPRILDWVLGNRGSLTERGRNKAVAPPESVPARGSPVIHAVKPEADLAAQLSNQGQSTLRRPIAIRATELQQDTQTPQGRAEALLEGLLGRIQSQGSGGSADLGLPPGSSKQPEISLPGHQSLTAGDLGRVMQWAGTELALRDRKVREAEKARDDDRRAHDAAMTAVGTEVARLKRGQAELTITHWTLQESLAQKDAELGEKAKMINQLSAGLAEVSQQAFAATKEAQHYKEECGQAYRRLHAQEADFLCQVEKLEAAAKNDSADLTKLVSSLKERFSGPSTCPAAAPDRSQ